MRKSFSILFVLLLTLACSRSGGESAIARLDETLAMKSTYDSYFFQRIEILRQLSTTGGSPYEVNKSLATEFSSYSLDSTVFYLERNREIARRAQNRYQMAETELQLAKEYGRAGYHSDAMAIVEDYLGKEVPEGLEYVFYEALNYIYGELAVYSSNGSPYWVKRDETRNKLLALAPEGSYEHYYQLRVQAESQQDNEAALRYALKALEVTNLNSRQYASACFFVASYLNDEDEKIDYLARSAIADIMCANKDYASLSELAKILYARGDIEHAFKYVADHCMPDALVFNGKLRPWQTAQFFPEIEKAYAAKSEANRRKMQGVVATVLILLGLLVVLLRFLIRRQRELVKAREELNRSKDSIERRNAELSAMNEQLSSVNSELQESNKVRQEYIALFLQSLSENISTDRHYKNHVLKYLRRGNEKYLIEEIESNPPIEEDIRSFYKMFDKTFINLYPNFIEKFNALLLEPEAPKGDDILTPEMRVFALIKLGISDSSKIASLLHYSANTIYNYRAKIKNKSAIDRDLFEDAVRAIE
ncbi:MAG: hypothetical protein IKR69_04635 [Bacteroidales bacterium]|nr:hypothetical protein [Bacteroidales bacterium]